MDFRYKLTDEACSAAFVKTAIRPNPYQMILIDPAGSTREFRSLYEELAPGGRSITFPKQGKCLEESDLFPMMELLKVQYQADAVKTAKNDAIVKQRHLECEAEDEARRIAKEEREKKDDEARDARNTEKLRWAELNGSAHLKKAIGRGFDCHRQYLEERAAIELPGFVFDWNDNALWSDCAGPTMETLELLDTLPDECDVVWLKRRHDDEDGYDEYDESEVIVLRKYLGSKYDLIRY